MKKDLWWTRFNKYIFVSFTIRNGVYAKGYGFSIHYHCPCVFAIGLKIGKDMVFLDFGRRIKLIKGF